MNHSAAYLENMNFVVMADYELTNYNKKIISTLYQPIVGPSAINLFYLLYEKVNVEERESEILELNKVHRYLKYKNSAEFLENLGKLEAVSLVETYRNNKLTIYVLHSPLVPAEFFSNILLSSLLEDALGKTEFENVQKDLLVTRYDLNNFTNVTKSIDEVFEIDHLSYNSEYEKWWYTIKKRKPLLTKNHFDFELLISLIEPLKILKDNILRSSKFFDNINSISFCFGLSEEQIAQAIKYSVTYKQDIDEERFMSYVKKLYDSNNIGSKTKEIITRKSEENKEIVEMLDSTPHNSIVVTRFGIGLIGSELEVLNTLNRKYNYSHGFINVLLVYVLEQTNGSFPSLNYFLKIGNSWLRSGIRSTADALNYIEQKDQNKKENKYHKNNNRTIVEPRWVEEHLQETSKKQELEAESLEELEKFFNKRS